MRRSQRALVGLARAAGLPARDVYGIRVGKSELGYKSLGTASENVTKAQHCRLKCTSAGLRLGPGRSALTCERLCSRNRPEIERWTTRWSEDASTTVRLVGDELDGVQLRARRRAARIERCTLGFLMYPQAETSQGRLDCLDPDNFKYEITSREIVQPAR